MSLDNPKKVYRNPCKTIGSGKCREYNNGIDLGGMTLRTCRRTSHELVPQCSLPLEGGLSSEALDSYTEEDTQWEVVWELGETGKG